MRDQKPWNIYYFDWSTFWYNVTCAIFWKNGNNLKTAHSKRAFWDNLKNIDVLMFSYECLKRNWWRQECCLHSEFFYLSSVSRRTLSLAVNFHVMHDLVPFVKFKKHENTHGGVLFLVNLACNYAKSDIPPWVFVTFFDTLYSGVQKKWWVFP